MTRALTVMTVIALLSSSALAGEVSGRGPNGGRLADAANMHVEFLTRGTEVFVYTFDHDNKPVNSAGMTGRLTVQEQGNTRTADLTAAPPNSLVGKLDAALAGGARVIVSLTPRNGKPIQARYTAN